MGCLRLKMKISLHRTLKLYFFSIKRRPGRGDPFELYVLGYLRIPSRTPLRGPFWAPGKLKQPPPPCTPFSSSPGGGGKKVCGRGGGPPRTCAVGEALGGLKVLYNTTFDVVRTRGEGAT